MLVQPASELQMSLHLSGSEQATSLVYSTLAAIPGNTSRNSGRNLSTEASTQPALAWLMFLAERVLWTIT